MTSCEDQLSALLWEVNDWRSGHDPPSYAVFSASTQIVQVVGDAINVSVTC
jgi:hypothetical protein